MAGRRNSAREEAGDGDETTETKDSSPPNFEQSLAELETVVRKLEDGQIGLDEALAQYEHGIRLLKVCRQSLQIAERKIMLLTGVDADGNPITESFGESAETLEEKKDARVRRRSRGDGAGTTRQAESESPAAEGDERQRGLF